jgi:GNAT superfamily N-acetyltransferase
MKQKVRKNFEEKAAYFATVMPNMAVVDHGIFLTVDCGLPSDTFNVIVARDLSDPVRILDEGVGYFMAKGFPMAIWYWEEDRDKSGMDALIDYGLAHNEIDVAMVADLTVSNFKVARPEGLIIKYVESPDEIRQYGAVVADLFGDSEEGQHVAAYFNLLGEYRMSDYPAMRHYIGLINDQAVATGLLFIDSDTAGIYDIVTRVEYRRRGIGSAMFAHILNEARSYQHRYVVLQASTNGIGIYLRADFTPAGDVHVFENRALL